MTCRAGLLLLAAMTIAPGSAGAVRGGGNLSPRFAELTEPSLQSASPAKQARALDLAVEGPGSLLRKGERVFARVRFDHGALSALDDLRSAGAQTIDSSGLYQTATIAAKPAQLRAIASVPGVEGVTPILSPLTAAPVCPSGAIVSEGDEQLNARVAREGPPALDGSGVTVGILSDSFDQATEAPDGSGKPIATHASDDVGSGDLPGACADTATQVLSKLKASGEATDEGRAMAQIVHDLAPKAKIKFASAFNSEESFAHNIEALAAAGADVIVDDVFYQEEPFFQDGQVAVAVEKVVKAGTTYFSAAGNNNLIDAEGHDIASWETPEFRDAQSCPPEVQALPGANGSHCLDFDPGAQIDKTFGMRVEPGATLTVDLQWSEPWNGVATDLDSFLLDADGDLIAQAREKNVEISQMPFESFAWTNISATPKTVQLAVNRVSGGSPAVKFALIENGGGVEATEYPRSSGEDVVGPTIFGHSGTAAAISTGAVFFNDDSEPEPYSSMGPVRHDFGPFDEKGVAEPLEPPEAVSKPDLTATDCGKTTFFAFLSGGFWHFCGTSAAAPHAAAVAALMLQAEPLAEPEDIREALLGSAVMPFEPKYGPCSVGAGLVEAVGAIESLLAPTPFTPPICDPPVAGSPEEARAPGDWGSESHPPSFTPPVVPPPSPPPGPEVTVEPQKPRPRTFILMRPPRVIRTQGRSARVVLRLGSDEADVSYTCGIDGGFFRPCSERLARRFGVGSHVVLAVARDAAGNDDRTPAVVRFRVKHVG